MDLCSECERALAQTDDHQLTSALQTSQKLLASCGLEGLAIAGEGEGEGERERVSAKAAELSQLQLGMMEVCVCVGG